MATLSITEQELRELQAKVASDQISVSNYVRQLGGVLGIAIVAVFVEWRAGVHGAAAPGIYTAYSQAFLLLATAFGLALVAASRMKPRVEERS